MRLKAKKPGASLNAVVYATDFSIFSESAGRYASLLAKYFSAQLYVAHAFIPSQAAMEVEAESSSASRQRYDLQTLLSREASGLASGAGSAVPVLLDGDPKDAIPQLAAEHKPAIIVLGTHGGSGLMRELIGSNAERILRSTQRPCLTVGPHVLSSSSVKFPFTHILYATDFSPIAAKVAGFAVRFAEAFHAEIDILNVIQPEAVDHPESLSETTSRFYDALDDLVPEEAKRFCDPRTFVETGEAHHRILKHIESRSIDLLILGIHKSSHLGMEMRTSPAFQLIVDAACPVLTITG